MFSERGRTRADGGDPEGGIDFLTLRRASDLVQASARRGARCVAICCTPWHAAGFSLDLARFALSPPVYAPKETLELLVTPQPNGQGHLLAPGDHLFALTLSAHNTDARYYMLTFAFDPATTPPVAVRGPVPVAWTFATPSAFRPS